jgi:hypothetical protein
MADHDYCEGDCGCYDQECRYASDNEPVYPECESRDHDIVCGDHGNECENCGALYSIP